MPAAILIESCIPLSKTKSLCDWSKADIKSDAARLAELAHHATYHCIKCARVANDKQVLCKPKKLPPVGSK